MIKSHYASVLKDLKNAIEVIGDRKDQITSIKEEFDACGERYPCGGHGDLIVTFHNGSMLRLDTGSVGMGAIMWYYKQDNPHFTSFINEDFQRYLTENL